MSRFDKQMRRWEAILGGCVMPQFLAPNEFSHEFRQL